MIDWGYKNFSAYTNEEIREVIECEKSIAAHKWGWNIGGGLGIAFGWWSPDGVGMAICFFLVVASGILCWHEIDKKQKRISEIDRRADERRRANK